jgi:hypothetical protein
MGDELPALDDIPGYRRRFRVTPGEGWVRAELEDDYHCMSVVVRHADGIATAIVPKMHRAPWSTCPGAEARLVETFTGAPLAEFAARGEKTINCTHLHDLATLAAVHADDKAPLTYDVLRSDSVGTISRAELRRDGVVQFAWTLDDFRIVAPPDVAGIDLLKLKPLLERLDPAGREAVRILRWGIMVGNGRGIPLENQSDARRMPPNCFTFQPDMATKAKRIGVIRDFSTGDDRPLDGRSADAETGLDAAMRQN